MSTPSRPQMELSVPRVLVENEKVIFLEAITTFVVIWSLAAHVFGLTDTIASPWLLAVSTYNLLISLDWISHVLATFKRTMLGFVVTMVVGTMLGVSMGWSTFFEDAFKDYVLIGLALPSLFAVIFSAMWFGISPVTPMVASAAISFPFVTQALYQGVKDIDPGLIEMSTTFNVSRYRVIRRVIVESIMPEWFAGARYAFAVCWKITTLAEYLAAENGIGYMIAFHIDRLSLLSVLTWTFLFMLIIVIAEYGIFQQIEKRVFEWRQETTIGLA